VNRGNIRRLLSGSAAAPRVHEGSAGEPGSWDVVAAFELGNERVRGSRLLRHSCCVKPTSHRRSPHVPGAGFEPARPCGQRGLSEREGYRRVPANTGICCLNWAFRSVSFGGYRPVSARAAASC
jgi:hypothetical protein